MAEKFMKRVAAVQSELKAPKNQYNSFGKYNYRSCEDILETAKPLCIKHGLILMLSDEIVYLGDRYYVKATATLRDAELDVVNGAEISNTAYAREAAEKKGMDESQITGTASSYARKYALNGLFCIDDTKDADTDEHARQTKDKPESKPVLKCGKCGRTITDAQKKDGTYLSAQEYSEISNGLCVNCCKEAQSKPNES